MIDGHGALMHKFPPAGLPVTSTPFSSTKTGCTPGNGRVAKVGLAGVIPAKFEIKMLPVSVCHQVSTMGHFFFPTCSSYQCQASSLIGSPTVPRILRDERFFPSNGCSPNPMSERMAVGAVYKIFTLCLSTISQNLPAFG